MLQNILIIGSGAREHALAWKLSQSKNLGSLFVAPGNAGTTKIATNVALKTTDIPKLVSFAKINLIDLTIVGPDEPLALGIVDKFKQSGLKIFGPTKQAAKIEWSKSFAKKFMQRNGIPTAGFKVFSDHFKVSSYIKNAELPMVIKVSGLALGKGVFVCHDLDEASQALKQIFIKKIFGKSGRQVVVEEYLKGEEISTHAISNGKQALIFPPAQDHKTIYDNGKGPNTGGMGSFTPVVGLKDGFMGQVKNEVFAQTLKGLSQEDKTFTGCLFPGLMITNKGFKVLEFNARFGDPETQSYMKLLKSDLLKVVNDCVDGRLGNTKLSWFPGFAVCVVLASKGYPGEYSTGKTITGIEEAEKIPGITVFHAGTKKIKDKVVTNGGRVLSVTATANSLHLARKRVYEAVSLIKFDGMQFRKDIAAKALTKHPKAT